MSSRLPFAAAMPMLADLTNLKELNSAMRTRTMSDTPSDVVNHSDDNSPRASSLVACVAGGLAIYVGVFAILFLDSEVWKTRFFDRWIIPTACHIPLRILFYPLLLICHWLGWLADMPPIR